MAKKIIVILLFSLTLIGCGNKEKNKNSSLTPAENTEQSVQSEKLETQKPEAILSDANKYQFDSTSIKTSPVAVDKNRLIQLIYKFNPGKTYNYRFTTISKESKITKIDSTVTLKSLQTVVYLLSFKFLNAYADETFKIQAVINSLRIETKTKDGTEVFDTDKTQDSKQQKRYADYLAICNSPFTLRVTKFGEIKEVNNLDEMINKYLSYRALKDSVNEKDKKELKNLLKENGLYPVLEQVFRKFPEKYLGQDSIWYAPKQIGSMLIYKTERKNTAKLLRFEKFDDDLLAVISTSLNIKFSGADNINSQGVSYKFKKPLSLVKGRVYFNLNKGIIQRSKVETKLELYYKMKIPAGKKFKSGETVQTSDNLFILEYLN